MNLPHDLLYLLIPVAPVAAILAATWLGRGLAVLLIKPSRRATKENT